MQRNRGKQVQTAMHMILRGDEVKIVSMIYYAGKWTPQEEVPQKDFREQVEKIMKQAGKNIGLVIEKKQSA